MSETVENTLLGGQVRLLQPVKGYRTAIDPVLLAATAPVAPNSHIADFGCGVGAIGFCLHHFTPDIRISGFDIQPDLIDLARRNAGLNNTKNLNFFLEIIDNVQENEFDHIITNPPYYEEGTHAPSPLAARAIAHSGRLEYWISACARSLKKGGTLNMIVPAMRYEDVRKYFRTYQLGAVEIFPLYSKIDKPAKRLIFQARLHKSGETLFHRGLVLHQENGDYTPEAHRILTGQARITAFQKEKK